MPHLRKRYATPLLNTKLGFSPVVSIQGARQTGKSTLAREILDKQQYITLDRPSIKDLAQENPEIFLEEQRLQAQGKVLVIDEAQKAPRIFDQIKYLVDLNKKPGQFLLLGSTEFSKELLIRESLLGRISRMRLYPMTLSETLEHSFQSFPVNGQFASKNKITRTAMVKFLNHGGYPGMFAIRNETERKQKIEDWLTLTCERDALLFPKLKGDSDLCRKILALLAKVDEPNISTVAHALKVNPRRVATQFEILSQLFVIHRLNPHPLGTGKPHFFLNDPGIAHYLGASFERKLQTALLLEFLARRAYSTQKPQPLYYYRNTKGSLIHFVFELESGSLSALKLISEESFDLRNFEILTAFAKKAKTAKFDTKLSASCANDGKIKERDIVFSSWEAFF